MEGTALFITAFPVGNYRGAGAGEQISLLRVQDLARVFRKVVVLVCSHVGPPVEQHCAIPDNVEIRHIRVTKVEVLACLLRSMRRHSIFRYRDTGRVRAAIGDVLQTEDVRQVFFDFSQTFSLVDAIPPAIRRTAYVHDVQYQRTARQLGPSRWTAEWVRAEERRSLSRFDQVVALSTNDGRLLQSLYGTESTVDNWEALLASEAARRLSGMADCFAPDGDGFRLVFYGNLRRPENWLGLLVFLAAFSVCKLFLKPVKLHRLVVVGECPRWLAIGLGWFRGTVRVTGFVPEPFRWLASADIFLAPLLTGAGVKLKVKEYQRFKAPILGTATAFEGIAKRPIDAECDPFAMALRILEALKTGRKG